MRKLVIVLAFASLVFGQPAAAASAVGQVRNFGPDLSGSCNLPEGVAVDPTGNVYASSLNFGAASGPANICVLDPGGNIIDLISVAPVSGGVARNPHGPESSFDPAEPGVKKRVQRGGSFLCTDQYCTRYMVGTRGKGEVSSASNNVGVRFVQGPK